MSPLRGLPLLAWLAAVLSPVVLAGRPRRHAGPDAPLTAHDHHSYGDRHMQHHRVASSAPALGLTPGAVEGRGGEAASALQLLAAAVPEESSEDRRIGMIEGLVLMGLLIFFVSIIQMMQYPDPQVRCYSYKTIFAIISIFEALSFVMIQNEVFLGVLVDPYIGGRDSAIRHAISFLLFVLWFLGSTAMCWIIRHDPDLLFAATGILSHICGFVLVEAYSKVQMEFAKEIEAKNGMGTVYALYLASPFVVALVFFPLRFFMKRSRKAYAKGRAAANANADPFLINGRTAVDEPAPADGAQPQDTKDNEPTQPPPVTPNVTMQTGAVYLAMAARQKQVSEKEAGGGGSAEAKAAGDKANTAVQVWMKAAGVKQYDEAEAYEHWMVEVDEAENQTSASVQGYLICRACYCLAVNHVPPVDCEADKLVGCYAETRSFYILAGSLVVLYVLTYLLPKLAALCPTRNQEGGPPPPKACQDEWNFAVMPNVTLSLLMGMSWCVLVLVRWALNEGIPGGTAGHRIVNAFAMSPLCAMVVIVMDKLADM